MWVCVATHFEAKTSGNLRATPLHTSLESKEMLAGALIRRGRPIRLSLERSKYVAPEVQLPVWDAAPFDAVVDPDLPPLNWAKIVKNTFEAIRHPGKPSPSLVGPTFATKHPIAGASDGEHSVQCSSIKVQTVGAQLRSRKAIRAKMLDAAEHGAEGLLLVSGGHPARRLPGAPSLLANCFTLLDEARTLRSSGDLPPNVTLGVVENPMVNPAARLQRKIDAGAEVVWTQPPLLWGQFEDWWAEAERRQLPETVPIIVGLAIPTSVRSLQLWLQLSDAIHLPEAKVLVEQWTTQQNRLCASNEAFTAWRQREIQGCAERIWELPGVSGIHVMPITAAGYREVKPLLESQVLLPKD